MFEPTTLTGDLSVRGFRCGVEELDNWLKTSALSAKRRNIAVTEVWLDPETDRVVAYYSISPTCITAKGLPRSATAGLKLIPSYLLARLALDTSLQGQGLGTTLLTQAVGKIIRATQEGGGRLIVVDPIDDDAASFYAHFGFLPVGSDSRRMYMKVSTARAAASDPASP